MFVVVNLHAQCCAGEWRSYVVRATYTALKLTATVAERDEYAGTLHALWNLGLEGLNTFKLEAGVVWTLPHSGRKVLIRSHYPRLLKLLCHDMGLQHLGEGFSPSPRNKGLLVGSPGTGKSTFMWVAAIHFMKMALSRDDAPCRPDFNPKVRSLRFQWSQLLRGREVYLGPVSGGRTCVAIYDAGVNLKELPPQTCEFAIAGSSTEADHFRQWRGKDSVQPRYSKPWEWSEIKSLSDHLPDDEYNSDLVDKFTIVGGNPRALFGHTLADLAKQVDERVASLTLADVNLLEEIVRGDMRLVGGAVHGYSLLQVVPHDGPDDTKWGGQRNGSVRAACAVWVWFCFVPC